MREKGDETRKGEERKGKRTQGEEQVVSLCHNRCAELLPLYQVT